MNVTCLSARYREHRADAQARGPVSQAAGPEPPPPPRRPPPRFRWPARLPALGGCAGGLARRARCSLPSHETRVVLSCRYSNPEQLHQHLIQLLQDLLADGV